MYRTLTATCISFFVLSCSNETAVEAPADGQPLSNAEMRVIYGEDNRLDRYQVTGVVAQLADSTVALMNASSVSWNGSGYNLYVGQSYAEAYSPLCFDEPFREQPATAWCSGFPVGPDLIATAGHCVDSSTCDIGGGQAAFVFGYHMLSATGVQSTVGADDVYFCEQVVQRVENTVEDWAVVKLTRNLVGHTPLNFRRLDGVDRVPTGTPVLVSGHPMGLPVKIAGGATVKNNSNGAYFDSNLDTYGGNSGSPVVNADRLANNEIFVEGILVRGATDLTVSGGCYTSNTCSDTVGCSGDGTFEDVTRTYLFADLVTVCGNGVREGAEACDACLGKAAGGT